MIKKYLTYAILAMFSILMVSCGGSTGGDNVDKGFLEKYKYTIKSKAQADEYAKDDGFLKINDKEVDFFSEMTQENGFQIMLYIKVDKSFNTFELTPLINEEKLKLQYYISSYPQYEKILLNTGTLTKDTGTINLDLEHGMLLFESPKMELKQTKDGKESVFVEFKISNKTITAGSASVTLHGDEILINNGDLGKKTYRVLKKLLNDNPNVKTIVLGNLDGSVDDEINVETGRMIRARGLNTKVLANSNIASGAVDLFASGVERIYTKGAKVGVHSWSNGEKGGDEYPKDDKAHHSQLGYFTAMLPDTGYDFYFYTLTSAPANDIYYMKESEILKYKLATKVIE